MNYKITIAANAALEAYDDTIEDKDYFAAGNVSGYITNRGYYLIISFSGSNELSDWITNLNTRQTKQGIHKGWWNSYKKVKPILDDILSVYPSEMPAIVTGHSAGGALAGIYALFNARKRPITLITFGCPLWATPSVACKLAHDTSHYFRVTHRLDPVALLPLGKYSHGIDPVYSTGMGNPHSMITYHKSILNCKPRA